MTFLSITSPFLQFQPSAGPFQAPLPPIILSSPPPPSTLDLLLHPRRLVNPISLRLINFRPASPTARAKHQPAQTDDNADDDEDGVPSEYVKTLVKFKSRHNYIRVLKVSSRLRDHPLAGSRLLLLDKPGNIHSIFFLLKTLTSTCFDVFATLPPLLAPCPIAILGFGAGSAARIILRFYPETEIHGWELDPSVVEVGREYFGLAELERENPERVLINIGNALEMEAGVATDGFSGILVDLFSRGSLLPELQVAETRERLKQRLRAGGRMMVNCGGSCVEAEDPRRNGELVKEETLKAVSCVFKDVLVLNAERRRWMPGRRRCLNDQTLCGYVGQAWQMIVNENENALPCSIRCCCCSLQSSRPCGLIIILFLSKTSDADHLSLVRLQ